MKDRKCKNRNIEIIFFLFFTADTRACCLKDDIPRPPCSSDAATLKSRRRQIVEQEWYRHGGRIKSSYLSTSQLTCPKVYLSICLLTTNLGHYTPQAGQPMRSLLLHYTPWLKWIYLGGVAGLDPGVLVGSGT